MNDKRISFIGTGMMGGAMAVNLARAGVAVRVWNRTKNAPGLLAAVAAGAQRVDALDEVFRNADVVFCCLSDGSTLETALFGATEPVKLMSPDGLVIDTSTIGPEAARKIEKRLRSSGFKFLDAPVTGGDVGARNATLTVMCGGAREDYDAALPLLNHIGSQIEYCGPSGSGQSLKLINQTLCGVTTLAVAEAMHFAQFVGIDPGQMVRVCNSGAAGSWSLEHLGPRMIESDFRSGFKITHMRKDLELVAHVLDSSDCQLPCFRTCYEAFSATQEKSAERTGELCTQAILSDYG